MDDNFKRRIALARLHAGLPRQGPGSDDTTANALKRLPAIPSPARIYDLGCGPGRASLVLASILKQKIVAVDLREDFLSQLRNNAAQKGMTHLIETRCGDIGSLHDEAGTVNLIWSEGAIYCVGFDMALTSWRPLLVDAGLVVCSEMSWLVTDPSEEPMTFWQTNYPAMRSVAQNVIAAEQLGYACLDHFTLPEPCWWQEYYNPLQCNIDKLKKDAEHDDFLRAAIANALEEIDIYRRFNHVFGYEFYLLQKSSVSIQRASVEDAQEIARVFRLSRQSALPYLPDLHSADDDLCYFYEHVFPKNDVFAARDANGQIIGFVAFDDEWINHLYLSPKFTGRTIGQRLLNIAKAQRKKLRLWTFKKNQIARQFYSKHGFNAITETDGAENEEKEPDVLFEWVGSSELSPSHLTNLLLKSGTLNSGSVVSVETKKINSQTGTIQQLKVVYSSDADPALSNCIVAKRVEISQDFGTRELDFYRLLQAKKLHAPLPSCLAWEVDQAAYSIFLEDHSETHEVIWERELSLAQAHSVAIAMADLHALWWGRKAPSAFEQHPSEERIQKYLAIAFEGLEGLLSDGDFLEKKDIDLILDVLKNAKRTYVDLADQAMDRLTLTHCDPNPGNILSPKADGGRTYLIDRQPFDWSLSFWLGASDLSLMMVHWWPTETRRKLEREIVRVYTDRLLEHGKECAFTRIWDDYRICATQSLIVALSRCRDSEERNRFAWVWKPQLKKTLTALADLDSIQLFH